ncbi:metallophosphoesterase [Azohydromonas australica]|uniref:metallophosphoesterase n=1 Tax=Azohydromonas australica TaxID=364039 RepID=UPI0004106268|nr:metallophosphoesterase [Azohydromonas australica]
MHADLPGTPLDIVGDVHGEHEALCALLAALGYDEAGNHAEGRTLVFVGDLCDRGPDSPGVVGRVRRLVDAGRAVAVLGNHELNLLRGLRKHGNDWFWNEDPRRDAKFMPFTWLQDQQQRADMRAFFERLPLALSRADLRVVHAAWHAPSLSRLAALPLDMPPDKLFEAMDAEAEAALQVQGLHAAARIEKGRWRHRFSDPTAAVPMLQAVGQRDEARQMLNPLRVLTSGVERCAQVPFFASGQWRFTERVRWWDGYRDETPVVVGHYWRQFPPLQRQAMGKGGPDLFEGVAPNTWLGARGNVFCVDFSVGGRWQERLGGEHVQRTRLAALRWPERELVLDSGERLPTIDFNRG